MCVPFVRKNKRHHHHHRKSVYLTFEPRGAPESRYQLLVVLEQQRQIRSSVLRLRAWRDSCQAQPFSTVLLTSAVTPLVCDAGAASRLTRDLTRHFKSRVCVFITVPISREVDQFSNGDDRWIFSNVCVFLEQKT